MVYVVYVALKEAFFTMGDTKINCNQIEKWVLRQALLINLDHLASREMAVGLYIFCAYAHRIYSF